MKFALFPLLIISSVINFKPFSGSRCERKCWTKKKTRPTQQCVFALQTNRTQSCQSETYKQKKQSLLYINATARIKYAKMAFLTPIPVKNPSRTSYAHGDGHTETWPWGCVHLTNRSKQRDWAFKSVLGAEKNKTNFCWKSRFFLLSNFLQFVRITRLEWLIALDHNKVRCQMVKPLLFLSNFVKIKEQMNARMKLDWWVESEC